jgi:hypothetical protein
MLASWVNYDPYSSSGSSIDLSKGIQALESITAGISCVEE